MANEIARKLRKTPTTRESRVWVCLRGMRKQGWHFRRQAPLEGYIVDFVCFSAKLVVELDGGQHGLPENRAADAVRDAKLEAEGFQVLRFWNIDVDENLDGVIEAIGRVLLARSEPRTIKARTSLS